MGAIGMKVEQFFYIVEIADTGSFSQAARNLYVSQPNLSHAVKQVEQEVGFPLFTRTSMGVIPTPEGSALIEHFRVIKREYDQIRDIAASPARPSQLSLRVGTMAFDRSTPVFSNIIKHYIGSPINFSFLNYSSLDQLLPLVETCQMDFAIIGTLSPYVKTILTNLSNRSIEYHQLADTPICALVGPENPLYNGPDVQSLKALYPYTIVQHGNAADDPGHSLPHVTGLSAHAFGEVHVNSSRLFYNTIQSTPAVGLVAYTPTSFRKHALWSSIRILQLSDCDVTAQFGWIKHRRLPLTDIASDLLRMIAELF